MKMKLTIKKLVLQSLVEKAGSIVAGSCREIMPVLKNFRISATEGKLVIVATDLDLALIAETTMVYVEEPGDAIVPAKKLLDIVKEVGDVDIVITISESDATVSVPTTSWKIQLMKADYPAIPDATSVEWLVIKGAEFGAGLKKVRNAVSSDVDKRPELTLVKCGNDGIYATDGSRLHVASVQLPMEFELPLAAVDDLIKLLRSAVDSTVRIAQTDTHILFEITNNVFIASKLQVAFPSIIHIINSKQNNHLELQVGRDDFISAVKRAKITADEETNRLILSVNNNELIIQTQDKLGNACTDKLQVYWSGPKCVFATNWQYILQAVADMESPNIRLLFGQDRGKVKPPIVLEEPNFYAIVNQLRVDVA